MSRVEAKGSKPWWWKPLWIAVSLTTIASGVVGYFLLHAPLERVMGGVALTFLCIGIAYYIRIKPSMKVNRAIYITLGASGTELIILFGGAFIILATGLPPPTHYLGPWISTIILFIAPWIIGAFIGDWIGRRRNYRLPLSP
jgi:hypothetical protein